MMLSPRRKNRLPKIVVKTRQQRRTIRASGRRVVRFLNYLIVAYPEVRAEDRWIEWLESKLALLLDRDSVDPRAYGGKAYDE